MFRYSGRCLVFSIQREFYESTLKSVKYSIAKKKFPGAFLLKELLFKSKGATCFGIRAGV